MKTKEQELINDLFRRYLSKSEFGLGIGIQTLFTFVIVRDSQEREFWVDLSWSRAQVLVRRGHGISQKVPPKLHTHNIGKISSQHQRKETGWQGGKKKKPMCSQNTNSLSQVHHLDRRPGENKLGSLSALRQLFSR